MPTLASLRKRILGGENAAEALALAGLVWSTDMLVPWSHWITPSVETKRFSARFFLCELPSGQVPSFDDIETVDDLWVRPADAIARAASCAAAAAGSARCWELAQLPRSRRCSPRAASAARSRTRSCRGCRSAGGGSPCLLLPWDPEYVDRRAGDATPLTYRPRWAIGPSRFVLEDRTWKHVDAPGSTNTV